MEDLLRGSPAQAEGAMSRGGNFPIISIQMLDGISVEFFLRPTG